MHRMILHIGNSKTGTTSLQRFFFQYRKPLSDRGILYPVLDDHPSVAQHNLAYSVSPLPHIKRLYGDHGLTFEKLAAMLVDAPEDIVLLSSEFFGAMAETRAGMAKFAAFSRNHGLEVDIVVFVRAQHLSLEAAYAQRTKAMRNGLTFGEFIDAAMAKPHHNYHKYLAAWDGMQGIRLVPVPFTAARLKPDLATVFFDATGLSARVCDLLKTAERFQDNRRPGPLTVELCRQASFLLSANPNRNELTTDPRKLERMQRYFQKLTDRAGWNETAFIGLDNSLRDRIKDAFAEDNERFAQQYWSEPWQDIFAKDYAMDFLPNDLGQSEISSLDEFLIEKSLRGAARKFGLQHTKKWTLPRLLRAQARHWMGNIPSTSKI